MQLALKAHAAINNSIEVICYVEHFCMPYNFCVMHKGKRRLKKINRIEIFVLVFLDIEKHYQNSASIFALE